MFPRNRFAALLVAAMAGVVVPLCECSIVPVTRSLVTKGLPRSVAFTFMIATPLLNPIVLLSTHLAFRDMPVVVFLRFGVGFIAAITIGLVYSAIDRLPDTARSSSAGPDTTHHHLPAKHTAERPAKHSPAEGHHHARIGYLALALAYRIRRRVVRRRVLATVAVLVRTMEEFVETSRFFLIGVFVTSALKLLFSITTVARIGRMPIVATPFMMAFTYVSSVCSEADAFIARTLVDAVPVGAITAFLVFGPMIDLKNTLQLLKGFPRRTVIRLVCVITAVCLGLGLLTTVVIRG